MQSNATIQLFDQDKWQSIAARFLDYSYQQSWAYGEALARRDGAVCEHVAVTAFGEVIGAACVRIRTIPLVGCGIAYISGGPLVRRADSNDDIDRLHRSLEALRAEYADRRGLILRILAPIATADWNDAVSGAYAAAGWAVAEHSRSYRTFLLDIDRPLDDIRAGCSKYWRRNLRRAEKKTFNITTGTTSEYFEPIRKLYQQLLHRKSFLVGLDADFYAELQGSLRSDEHLVASLVESDDGPHAGLIYSMLGDTCVPLVLASDQTGLRDYAVYLLQWSSIEIAQSRGMRQYDLGGIDPEGNPGVYNFKKGLRGVDLRSPGPFEAIPSGVRCAVTRGAETIYRRFTTSIHRDSGTRAAA